MKIAFVGKGGSGETALSALFALFARHLAASGSTTVVAVDAGPPRSSHFPRTHPTF